MAANILDGYTVLVTAVHVREREELARTLSACGGQFTSSVSLKDPPHVVITRSVKSPKYRALLRAHPHTPVVTPEWLAASAQVGGGGPCLWLCAADALLCHIATGERMQHLEVSICETIADAVSLAASAAAPGHRPLLSRLNPPAIPCPSAPLRRRGACSRTTATAWAPSTA